LKEETVAFSPTGETEPAVGFKKEIQLQKRSLIVVFPESSSEFIELNEGSYRIGRSEESDLFLNDLTVSRKHAVLTVKGRDVLIEDLGSLNGTFVNGNLIEERTKLKDGDIIQIGRFRLLYRVGEVDSNE
jgi:pSer/pThr/pTyr-binding forkhead associated (FHA) protein